MRADRHPPQLVDVETGEILEVIPAGTPVVNNTDEPMYVTIEVKPEGRVRSGNQNKRLYKTRERFVMVFQYEVRRAMAEVTLTDKEMAVLFVLMTYLEFDGTVQVHDERGQKSRITIGRLEALLQWRSPKTLRGVLHSLESKFLVRRIKDGTATFIDLNPSYFYVGDMDKRVRDIEAFEGVPP